MGYKYSCSSPEELSAKLRKTVLVPCQATGPDGAPSGKVQAGELQAG